MKLHSLSQAALLIITVLLIDLPDLIGQDDVLFDEIQLTEALNKYNLTGAGTILAVLDRGIDYRHPDFIKEDGTSRILYIYDLSDDTGANAPNNPYGKGTIYNNAEINQALQSGTLLNTRDASGHGTVTAGIACGNGRGSAGQYLGIAPEASIIIVKITSEGAPAHNNQPAEAPFSEIDNYLDEALDFIIAKADEMGMPFSAIANFGSIQGPMDGSSTLSRVIDERFSSQMRGRAFVCGSSDDGGRANHAGGQFLQNETIALTINKQVANLRLDLWHHESDEVSIEIATPTQTYGPYQSPENSSSLNDPTNEFTLYYQGAEVDFFGSTSPRKELLIDFKGPNGTYTLNITGVNVSDGRFDAILNPSNIITTTGNSEFTSFVEPGGTIWDLATAKNNICPNSYIFRTSWQNITGNTFNYVGDDNGVGSLWIGSGIGPTQDGRYGIDVSVPGNVNFGAYAVDSYFATFTGNLVFQNDEATYGTLAAVSGANPVLAGVISLMLEVNPDLSATEIKTILQETARQDNFTGNTPNNEWGYGKLDVLAAIDRVYNIVNTKDDVNALNADFEISPNPASQLIQISSKSALQQAMEISLFNPNGQLLKSTRFEMGQNRLSMDLSDLPAGLYVIKGLSAKGGFLKQFLVVK